MRTILHLFVAIVVLAVSLLVFSMSTPAQPQTQKDLYVVTYVDVFPNFAAESGKLLQQFASDSRKDPGCVRMDILRDVARQNHFTIFEVWKTQKDFDAHLALGHTRMFREKLQAGLGSPFDERLHNLLQ